MVDKYLPFYFNGKSDLDEELRMYYVAITRAIERLTIIHSPVIGTIFPFNRETTKGDPKRGTQVKVLEKVSPFISSYRNHMKLVK